MPNRCGDRCCDMCRRDRSRLEITIEGDCEIDKLLRFQGIQNLDGDRFPKCIGKGTVTVMAGGVRDTGLRSQDVTEFPAQGRQKAFNVFARHFVGPWISIERNGIARKLAAWNIEKNGGIAASVFHSGLVEPYPSRPAACASRV